MKLSYVMSIYFDSSFKTTKLAMGFVKPSHQSLHYLPFYFRILSLNFLPFTYNSNNLALGQRGLSNIASDQGLHCLPFRYINENMDLFKC